MRFLVKRGWLVVLIVSLIYYGVLCSKQYVWLFASGDSGDWLASSIIWMNSQPYGSPLYVLLGKLIYLIMPNNLVIGMTFILSVLPASIAVTATYLITKKLTDNIKYAFISALIILGASVFLTQATILEEYAISSMFITLALLAYVYNKKKLTILFLALGSAIHIICVATSIIWIFVICFKNKERREWLKKLWIYILVGLLPYAMVLILMYLPTPRFLAGELSLSSINGYLGSTGTIGTISWYEFLIRVPYFIGVIAMTLGLAVIPFIIGWKHRIGKPMQLMVYTIILCLWLYLTDQDPSTWTFLTFCLPMIAVMSAFGLQFMAKYHTKIIAYGATSLICVNAVFLNANVLANQYPLAVNFEQQAKELPDGSAVVTCSGGEYGLGIMYVYAQGKDIIPIFYSGSKPESIDYLKDKRYNDYIAWLNVKFQLEGNSTKEQVQYLLDKGKDVYILTPTITPYWEGVFQYEQVNENFGRVYEIKDY